jgi:hypothetical protein
VKVAQGEHIGYWSCDMTEKPLRQAEECDISNLEKRDESQEEQPAIADFLEESCTQALSRSKQEHTFSFVVFLPVICMEEGDDAGDTHAPSKQRPTLKQDVWQIARKAPELEESKRYGSWPKKHDQQNN